MAVTENRDEQRPEEAELENWLAGDSPLSRRYSELGDEQPPPELDRKILSSAAEASKVVPLERTTRRWGASIAVAATVLLCVSIVVNLSIQPDGPLLGEAPPQVEFADRPSAWREAESEGDSYPDGGRLDALRRRSQPAMAPPSVAEEVMIEPSQLETAPQERMVAAPPAAPGRESLDTGLASPVVRPSLDLPPAKPARDDEQLARAIELLEARRADDRAVLSRMAGNQQKTETLQHYEEPLDAILAAWNADDPDLAWARLQAFLRDYPEHPFSRQLTGQN
jgi:hypothetical protein